MTQGLVGSTPARHPRKGTFVEKETLEEIKALEKKARKLLASVRRARRESRPRAVYSYLVDHHVRARKSGDFTDANHEIYTLDKLLERDDLSASERKTFNRRKKSLSEKIT